MTRKHKGALSKSNHEVGDCWELCNIASDDILLDSDTVMLHKRSATNAGSLMTRITCTKEVSSGAEHQ